MEMQICYGAVLSYECLMKARGLEAMSVSGFAGNKNTMHLISLYFSVLVEDLLARLKSHIRSTIFPFRHLAISLGA